MDTAFKREDITLAALAQYLGVHVNTIYLWVRETDIPYQQARPGGKMWFRIGEVEAWLKKRKESSRQLQVVKGAA
ncbi:MAG TPA: helix-turn-helix domain-containing protein [Blastocatellia bacterium]|nr:helix-turn-helix domain-containing protein [Blastocatellia bacterium]